jgi:hypothetical protein
LAAFSERWITHCRVAREVRAADDLAADRGDDRFHDGRGHVADAQQRVDRAERQRAGPDELLSSL